MKNRKIKIGVDILLTIFFVLSYGIFVGMSTQLHMVVGLVATMFSIAHIWINRKRFKIMFKISTLKKLKTRAKWQYGISLGLTISWAICVITGILIGYPIILYTLAGITNLFTITMIHILSASLSLLMVVVHIIQHLRQLKLYFFRNVPAR